MGYELETMSQLENGIDFVVAIPEKNYEETRKLLNTITFFPEKVIEGAPYLLPSTEKEFEQFYEKIQNISEITSSISQNSKLIDTQIACQLLNMEVRTLKQLYPILKGKAFYETELTNIVASPIKASTEISLRYIETFFCNHPEDKLLLDSTTRGDLITTRQMLRFNENENTKIEEYIGRIEDALCRTERPLVYKAMRELGYISEDDYETGMIGLLYAIRNFDIKKGFKFSTYAVKTIMCYIQSGRNDGCENIIRINRSTKARFNMFLKKANEMFKGKQLKELGIEEVESIIESVDWHRDSPITTETVFAIINVQNQKIIELDASINETEADGDTIGERIIIKHNDDDMHDLKDDEESLKYIFSKIDQLILEKKLTPRDKEIFHMCYIEGKKHQQIAPIYKITYQRVPQIINKVFRLLRTRIDSNLYI